MWSYLGRAILRNRTTFLVVLLLITAFFGWMASKNKLSYTYARALPVDDPAYQDYTLFKKLYGEDGSVMLIGFSDKNVFTLKKYAEWYDLTEKIRKIKGIQDALSNARLYKIVRHGSIPDSLSRFDIRQVVSSRPQTQEEVDSIKKEIYNLPFYDGLAYNRETEIGR